MKMYNFMKKSKTVEQMLSTDDMTKEIFYSNAGCWNRKTIKYGTLGLVFLVLVLSLTMYKKNDLANLEQREGLSLINAPMAATITKKDVISIPSGVVKANPFVPYRSIGNDASSKVPALINDVPKYDLIDPPEVVGEHTEAAKIMDTVVSGILYDKFSPSAILNIDGNDYLVKKGDTVNSYTVLAITQNSVTVKYGGNTYKAGIGEILSDGAVNYNDISNLNKKFGGEQR